MRRTELGQRTPADFCKADAQEHLVARGADLQLQEGDDLFLLVHVAGRDVHGLLDDVLVGDKTRQHDVLAAARDFNLFAGEQRPDLLGEPREVALHDHFVAFERPTPVPDEHRDRARHLAVDEELGRRRDQGVGDVGARQRDARNRRADVEDGRASHEQAHRAGVDLRGRRGGDDRRRRQLRPQHRAAAGDGEQENQETFAQTSDRH